MKALLTTAEAVAAGYLPSGRTAKEWRQRAEGPAYCRFGRLIRYRREDLEAWAARKRVLTRDCLPAGQRLRQVG